MQAVEELVAGRELDVLVAEKVMGYRWVPASMNSEQRLLARPGMSDEAVDQAIGLGHSITELAPHYSTDIADAWQVIEYFKAAGYEIQILYASETYFDWTVVFADQFGAPFAKANTAPLAICRAALEALRVISLAAE